MARPRSVALSYRPLFTLPAAVQDPATAPLGGGRFVLLGGITPAVTSTAAVTVADAHGPVGSQAAAREGVGQHMLHFRRAVQ